jgi:hypothetical protein
MNEPAVDWCRSRGLEVTRSPAYRKNDQAWVEQKNGAIVRRLVGYGRFEGPAAAAALARLYAAARLHANLFQPGFKLREKTRVGAQVTKRWHAPRRRRIGRWRAASRTRPARCASRTSGRPPIPVVAMADGPGEAGHPLRDGSAGSNDRDRHVRAFLAAHRDLPRPPRQARGGRAPARAAPATPSAPTLARCAVAVARRRGPLLWTTGNAPRPTRSVTSGGQATGGVACSGRLTPRVRASRMPLFDAQNCPVPRPARRPLSRVPAPARPPALA